MISRRTVIALPGAAFAGCLRAQPDSESPLFAFREGFWLNLHHFLYVLGRARNKTNDSTRGAVAAAPADLAGFADLPDDSQAAWSDAVAVYSRGLSKQDAVFDPFFTVVTKQLADAGDDPSGVLPRLNQGLRDALEAAAPVYRSIWWDRHAKANHDRIAELKPLLDKYGQLISEKLTKHYVRTWPPRGFTVDMVAYANWAGAYSTATGQIVFSSTDRALAGTQGLEAVFHEAMHQWDDSMERQLAAAAQRTRAKKVEQLSHSLIFYTAGYVVASLVPDHKPYAETNRLWATGMVSRAALDQWWRPYLDGKTSIEDALDSLLEALSA